jgi:NADH:ubiquinone oxidoreductase subunit F (NADH-binding)
LKNSSAKILTKHWGKIDPRRIGDYLNVGGYAALQKFISEMSPKESISEIKASGLSGRGGAGFSTGEKWEAVSKEKEEKFFICNLDESEPGTYKDRLICDMNPHMLLEGIIIGALSIGAKKAYIYINGNYEKQFEILKKAILDAEKEKYVGKKILGSDYELEIILFRGAGAYICGEETALISSIEGNRGEPKNRPPYPTVSGLFGKPTVVNNAETLANVPWIISNGGASFFEIGSASSPGTKLFLLDGAVKNKGCFEAPTGITVRELIEHFGGGIQEGKDFWFAQLGGACGNLILESELDLKLEFGKKCSCPMGSGSILVIDKTMSIHDLLVSWAGFFRRESCGKCVPCREGTFRLFEIVKRFRDGEISDRDQEAMKDILWTLERTTFCPFGRFAAAATRDAVEKLKILD